MSKRLATSVAIFTGSFRSTERPSKAPRLYTILNFFESPSPYCLYGTRAAEQPVLKDPRAKTSRDPGSQSRLGSSAFRISSGTAG